MIKRKKEQNRKQLKIDRKKERPKNQRGKINCFFFYLFYNVH